MASKKTGGKALALVFMLVSFVAAAFATGLVFWLLNRGDPGFKEQLTQLEQVVVAKQEIAQGHEIVLEDLEVKELPQTFIPSEAAYQSPEALLGLVPKERILPGEVIRQERLASPDAGRGLNALIPKGQRAMQIEVTGASSVGGLVDPGNFVDVLITVDDDKDKLTTKTLFQAKQVLAVDDRLGRTDSSTGKVKPTVTLALTPEEVQYLTHAAQTSDITLTLRNDVDVGQQPLPGVRPDSFIGVPGRRYKVQRAPGAPRSKPEPKPSRIQIIQGQQSKSEDY